MKRLFADAIPNFNWVRSDADTWKNDLLSGLVGAFVVIPQGISFAYLVGVPPEWGLRCAIWVTLLASLFGNSTLMSGPNTATSILMGLSLAPLALNPEHFFQLLILLTLLAGLVQLVFWITRISSFFDVITPAAVTGFMTGVGLLIISSSLNGMLGLEGADKVNIRDLSTFSELKLSVIQTSSLILATSTAVFCFAIRKYSTRYFLVLGLIFGVTICQIMQIVGICSTSTVKFLESIQTETFFILSPIELFSVGKIKSLISTDLVVAATAVAALSMVQTLIISRGLKLEAEGPYNKSLILHKEAFAIGMSNIVSSFFMSFAGSGSFNRTQISQEMKTQTPIAGISCGIIVLLLIVFAGPLFKHLPIPVISALLIVVGIRMIKPRKIRRLTRGIFSFLSLFGVLWVILFWGLAPAVIAAATTSLLERVWSVEE